MAETHTNQCRPPNSRQIAPAGIGFFWLLSVLMAQMLETQSASAQIRFPTTRFRSYGSLPKSPDPFPITPPIQKDSPRPAEINDFRSMSPDSWESPQSGFNSAVDPFRTSPNGKASSKSIPWMPSRLTASDLQTTPRSQTIAPEKMRPKNQGQPQTPGNNPHDQPKPNPALDQNKFRPSSFPLSNPLTDQEVHSNPESGTGNPLSLTPSMPVDIRLPDLELPNTPANSGSILEPAQSQLPNSPDQIQPQPAMPSGLDATGRYPLYPDRSHRNSAQEGLLAQNRQPPGRRGPVLTPTATPPLATRPPAISPDRVTLDNHYPPQSQFGFPATASPVPNHRPDLGHREPNALLRESETHDYGQTFDFEKKHTEYPKLGEILKTGRYFGSATALYLRPAFQANTSLFLNQSGVTETFDFAYKLAPKIQFGFESKFGPGVELEYWGFSDFSRVASFTSNGIETATTSAWMRGANNWSRLSAINAGETLSARHRMEVDVVGASFFKEVKLPKAKINGKFGFQTAHIIHELTAQVSNGAGTQIGSLRSRSDVRGLGPQFELEYFRPIGHTKLEFVTSASGSVLFGKQTQVIENSNLGNQSRMKADEFVMNFDFFSGAQYRLMFGENRYWFARTGLLYQAWLHGGTAVLPQDDFGLSGFAITVGLNR